MDSATDYWLVKMGEIEYMLSYKHVISPSGKHCEGLAVESKNVLEL